MQRDSTSQFDRPSNMVISLVRFVILMRHNEGLFTAPSNSLIFNHFCQFPQNFHFLSLLFEKSETSCVISEGCLVVEGCIIKERRCSRREPVLY